MARGDFLIGLKRKILHLWCRCCASNSAWQITVISR